MRYLASTLLVFFAAASLLAQTPQTSNDPFAAPIPATDGLIRVNYVEFATIPDVAGDPQPARMMLLVNEPGTRRLFVNDMRGPLYTVSYDGKSVAMYLDVNAENWGVRINSQGNERGFQSFAFHPQFNQPGTRGYGTVSYTHLTLPTNREV